MSKIFNFFLLSDIGNVRSENQDSVYGSANMILVADGMGGYAGGDLASSMITDELSKFNVEEYKEEELIEAITKLLENGQTNILNLVLSDKKLQGMGTTLSMLLLKNNKIYLFHIGDSRIYRIRDQKVEQLSKDHTYVQVLVDNHKITKKQAKNHPNRHIITKAISDQAVNLEPDVQIFPLKNKDKFLLCSDGLYGNVSNSEIEDILAQTSSLEEIDQKLIELAKNNGSTDNISVVLAEVVDSKLKKYKNLEHRSAFGGAIEHFQDIKNKISRKTKTKTKNKSKDQTKSRDIKNKDNLDHQDLNDAVGQNILQDSSKHTFGHTFEENVELAKTINEGSEKKGFWTKTKIVLFSSILAFFLILGGLGLFMYNFVENHYFIRLDADQLNVYHGINYQVGTVSFYQKVNNVDTNGIVITDLIRSKFTKNVPIYDSIDEAETVILDLK